VTDQGTPQPLLRTAGLTKHFHIGGGLSRRTLHAVDDVSLCIGEREIVALAGESGSGKSTIARLLAKVYKPTSGEIYFQGRPLSGIRSRQDTLRYTGLVPMVVLAHPKHPYTQLLLSAVPDPRAPLDVTAETDRGEPPRVVDPAPGCRFRWRCPLAIDTCHQLTPELSELLPGHDVACHVAQAGAELRAFG
jgi:oligopeptide/dipeptide ABC transporter ATP-binding protein